MFIYTAKLSKKKIISRLVPLIILGIVLVTAFFILRNGKAVQSATLSADTEEARLAFLKNFGWETSGEPEIKNVIIPKNFSDVYSEYNSIQLSQGFDLTDFAGLQVTEYTYIITNYPDFPGTVLCSMLVHNDFIIGGDIHSTTLDGFMHGFKIPN